MSDREFSRGFRGYKREEVDARMRADADQLAALRAEAAMLRSELDNLKANEDSIKQTMMLAQKAREDALEEAKAEAAKIVQDARQQADAIVKENRTQIEALRWDLEKLQLDKHRFIDNYRKLLEDNLRELAEANKGLTVVEGQTADEAASQ